MSNVKFRSAAHRDFFLEMMSRSKVNDTYHRAFFYVMGISEETRANKTRLKIREDTELKNFPLFCPKCKQEVLISIKQFNMSVIKEPDAKTQSR